MLLCVCVAMLQDFARDVMKIDAIPSKKLDTIKVREPRHLLAWQLHSYQSHHVGCWQVLT